MGNHINKNMINIYRFHNFIILVQNGVRRIITDPKLLELNDDEILENLIRKCGDINGREETHDT